MTFTLTYIFMLLVFWRPQEWLVPWLYGFPLLDIIVVCALLTLIVDLESRRLRVPKEVPGPLLIGGLLFAVMMSHIAHTYFGGLISTFLGVFQICFFTFLLFITLDSVQKLRNVVRLVVFMSATMAVHCLLQENAGRGFGGHYPLWMRGYTRSMFFGIFEDPNDTAQMMACSIPLAFCMTKNKMQNMIFGGVLTWLLILGVLSTHSDGGMVALLAVVAMMLAMWLPAKWTPTLLILMGLGFIVLCPLAGAFMDDSAHDRVAFWGTANWAFKSSPINMLFGVGKGMLVEYIPGDRAVHSMFVLCYSELGVFGYWFWFGMLYIGFIGTWRSRVILRKPKTYEQRWLKNYTGMAMASIIGFAASGYFLSRAYVYPLFFFMVMLGVVPLIVAKVSDAKVSDIINWRKDLYINNTIYSIGSIIYIYISIILLNKAWGI